MNFHNKIIKFSQYLKMKVNISVFMENSKRLLKGEVKKWEV